MRQRKAAREPIGIWYVAYFSSWRMSVEAVRVVSIGESMITYLDGSQETRRAIKNFDQSFFPTFDEAKGWAISKAEGRVSSLKDQLVETEEALALLRAL